MKMIKLGMGFALISCASVWAQKITPMTPAEEARAERMIAIVQRTPVSKLDRKLPGRVAFQDWLHDQAGPDARIAWAVRPGIPEQEWPDCVEADATLRDGRTFVVMIDASNNARLPRFREANVITGGRNQNEVAGLRDLGSVLRSTSQNLSHVEAQQ